MRGQEEAVSWVRRNLPHDSRIVIDDYMWYDLHSPAGSASFPNAIYYWNVEYDPWLRRRVLADNWRNVDYVITTPQMYHDVAQQPFPVVATAIRHSVLVREFNTGNWPVQIRRIDPRVSVPLASSSTGASEPACMTAV